MKNKFFYFTALLFICSCSNAPKTAETDLTGLEVIPVCTIECPLENVKPASQSFEFSNSTGTVVRTERQSIVIIPENAFVLEDGSKPSGPVKIDIMEVHNPAEIILSGIPMNVQKGTETVPFISDGMFDIDASCKGAKLKLAENKEISIGTVSTKSNEDFDYWYFDEKKGEWDNIGDRNERLSEEKVLAIAKEVNPEMLLKSDLTAVAPNIDNTLETIPEIVKPAEPLSSTKEGLYFNIRANYTEYPELGTYKNVLWKPVNKLSGKELNTVRNGIQAHGANVSLKCDDEYTQTYTISFGKESIKANPVFFGSDLAKAREAYKDKLATYRTEYNTLAKKQADKLKSQQVYEKTYNLFRVTQTGIYNCDRFLGTPRDQNQYTFRIGTDKVEDHIFAVLKNNEGVIALSSGYKTKDNKYSMPSSDVVGFVHTTQFGVVTYAKNDQGSSKDRTVEFVPTEKPIETAANLSSLLASF